MSARVFLVDLLSSVSFIFHNFMNSIYIAVNKSFLLCTVPAFDLVFPLKTFLIRFSDYAPSQFNRAPRVGIGFGVYTGLVLMDAGI